MTESAQVKHPSHPQLRHPLPSLVLSRKHSSLPHSLRQQPPRSALPSEWQHPAGLPWAWTLGRCHGHATQPFRHLQRGAMLPGGEAGGRGRRRLVEPSSFRGSIHVDIAAGTGDVLGLAQPSQLLPPLQALRPAQPDLSPGTGGKGGEAEDLASPGTHCFPDRQVGKAARETQSWWS